MAILLYYIMEDNPKLSTLYTTGVFFFILMYTGSNLLPIGRVLSMTHDKQAFRYSYQTKVEYDITKIKHKLKLLKLLL